MLTAAPCMFCKHFEKWSDEDGRPLCKAYPDGIPEDIYNVQRSHLVPQPGDHGIQFEGKPGFEYWGEMFAEIT